MPAKVLRRSAMGMLGGSGCGAPDAVEVGCEQRPCARVDAGLTAGCRIAVNRRSNRSGSLRLVRRLYVRPGSRLNLRQRSVDRMRRDLAVLDRLDGQVLAAERAIAAGPDTR